MKKGIRKLFSALLSVAVISSMSSAAFAAEMGTGSSDKSTEIVSTLGMCSPKAGTEDISIDQRTGTVTVKFETTPQKRQYTKFALIKKTKTDAEMEKAAKSVDTVVKSSDDGYSSEITLKIPASKLGKKMPFSVYQIYTKSDGTADNGWKKDWTNQPYITVEFTPELVDQLISSIQVQSRYAGTDMLCAAAKRGWDSLTEEEKEQVEEADYFGADVGSASHDDPLNQDGIGKTEILVASFGTSFNTNRVNTIGAIEAAIENEFPEFSTRRAFTAQIIINHIQARDGERIDNIEQALDRAVENGVKNLVVQPTTLMSGFEYDDVVKAVKEYESKFDQVVIGKQMCATKEDRETALKAVYKSIAEDEGLTVDEAKDCDTAYVLMGHGTAHSAMSLYTDFQKMAGELGYKNVFVGTVEGEPEGTGVEDVIKAVKTAGYKKVILRPIMVVAGDHANNDMAAEDDEESWYSMFTAAGIEAKTQIKGMGELAEIQDLFVEHAKAAADQLVSPAAASVSKLTAGTKSMTVAISGNKANSGYEVKYSTKASMANAKTKTVATTKATIKSLKSKTTYYVKVRSYVKSASGKKIYSAWSKAKNVKVK